ncbi:hypothetical protein AB9H19_29840 [Rhodococcus qingshengii]
MPWKISPVSLYRRVQTLRSFHRIDQRQNLQIRVLSQLPREVNEVCFADYGIGNQHPANTRVYEHPRLLHIGHSDTPGACIQVKSHQLRTHRGLCVGGKQNIVCEAVVPHEVQVAFKRGCLQRGGRKMKAAVEEIPSLPADIAQCNLDFRKTPVSPGNRVLGAEQIQGFAIRRRCKRLLQD